jgi:DNA-binding IclR family transcriptional regulator
MQSSIVHKLLALLNVVSEAQKPMTFSEIVDKTGLNKSTIHRLLSIGVEERMLRFDSHKKVYMLGPRIFDLVRNAHDRYDIQTIALAEMLRLHELLDVNVTIGVPSGTEVVYLRVIEARQSLGAVQRPGMREPIHCSASGKALLAYTQDAAVHLLLKGYDFKRYTDRTVTTAEGFENELAFVREHGFGKNNREEYEHFLGISAPIFNYLSEPTAVLNIWSVYPRHTIDDLIGWSSELKASAQEVSEMIGGIMPVRTDVKAR